ncbi:unnamed protein product, partial [Brenthis ino]
MHSRTSSLSSISDLFRPNNPKGLTSRDLSTTRLSIFKKEIQTDAHIIPLRELFMSLNTDPEKGLSNERAKELLDYYGPNTLTPTTHFIWPRLLFKALCTGFSILIWLGAIMCLTAYLIELSTTPDPSYNNLYLGCVLIGVDMICGLFSFIQSYKSSKIMKTFNSMIPIYATCLRDGSLRRDTQVRDLVKGDIVYVEVGDVIPADIRIIDSKGFKVDNSSLTGECVAVSRSNTDGTANILESPNVAFFSALCVEGWAKGRVAGLAARIEPAPSPLSREIRRFMRYMSIWALCLGIFIAGAGIFLGYPIMQIIVFVIGIVVANIPEGLQPTVTASLTLTAKSMVARNCLVKNLEAIEALGACTTICSDKTGTLTENKINASVSEKGVLSGDASEKAILNFLYKFDDPVAIRKKYPKVAEIPFNSVNKYQVSIHLDENSSKYLLVMKGAPEYILSRCSTVASNENNLNMTTGILEAVNKAIENLANTGERILAFADYTLDSKEYPLNFEFDTENLNFPIDKLRFLGLLGLKDPPREEVRSAIQRVREAGVRVMMVTGDHPATARAVALEVGIATTPTCHIVTGTELRNMTPDLLYLTLEKHYEIG